MSVFIGFIILTVVIGIAAHWWSYYADASLRRWIIHQAKFWGICAVISLISICSFVFLSNYFHF